MHYLPLALIHFAAGVAFELDGDHAAAMVQMIGGFAVFILAVIRARI